MGNLPKSLRDIPLFPLKGFPYPHGFGVEFPYILASALAAGCAAHH
jgi:hypothetical protein